MKKEDKYAFPDTNIFLHFQFFMEIDWVDVLEAKAVTLIVPPVVAKELDKHKYNHPSERIKDRATKITKKFAEILHSNVEIRPKVKVQFERIESENEFEKYHLSKDSQDDHLIASILRFQNESGNNAVLITNDFSLLVKAHQLNIEVVELPEKYQIKSEENPDKKKIAKLEKELMELKAKMPRLNLVSIDNSSNLVGKRLSVEKFSDKDINSEIKRVKKSHPKITKTKPAKEIKLSINGKPLESSPKVEFKLPSGETKQASLSYIEKYNKELEEFYEKFEKYLNSKLWKNNLRAKTITVQIKLNNDGTLPAERVRVVLAFPSDFQITTNKELFSYPDEIKPPIFFPLSDRFNLSSYDAQSFFSSPLPKFDYPKINIDWEKVEIERTASIYTASFQANKLSHGFSRDCPEIIYVTFPQNQEVKPFQINYKITADNLPLPIEGKANVLIEK